MPASEGSSSPSLHQLVANFAHGIQAADARRPQAVSARSGARYQPGVGPHTETATVFLVMNELRELWPDRYTAFQTGVPYPSMPRQRSDLCIGAAPTWSWAVEVKMLRLVGDNAKPNDNMLMHILSPYPAHRSALTDCEKLLKSGFAGRKAILIYGYDSDAWPLAPAVGPSALASRTVALSPREEAAFSGLIHPVHRFGTVFGWELR